MWTTPASLLSCSCPAPFLLPYSVPAPASPLLYSCPAPSKPLPCIFLAPTQLLPSSWPALSQVLPSSFPAPTLFLPCPAQLCSALAFAPARFLLCSYLAPTSALLLLYSWTAPALLLVLPTPVYQPSSSSPSYNFFLLRESHLLWKICISLTILKNCVSYCNSTVDIILSKIYFPLD